MPSTKNPEPAFGQVWSYEKQVVVLICRDKTVMGSWLVLTARYPSAIGLAGHGRQPFPISGLYDDHQIDGWEFIEA